MRIKRILAAMLSVTALTTGAFAQSGLNDPMTKAMMDVYDQEIRRLMKSISVAQTNIISSTSIYARSPTSTTP